MNVSVPVNPSFDPSALRICDSSPVKVTFLRASENERHILGFYTVDGNAFKDVRLLFSNAGNDTLIPNVSSVFLGNRLNGKTPVFFMIENGYGLNGAAEWFADAAAGKNGFWKFLSPCSAPNARPVLERGQIVWKSGETVIESAEDARLGTERPVPVWQSNDGRLFVPEGDVYHSFGYGLYPNMNPDTDRHAVLFPEDETSSVVLNFAGRKTALIETAPALSVRLQIGERNFDALTRNRVACFVPLGLSKETVVAEMTVALPDDSPDSLYLEGLEEQTSLPAAQRTFSVENAGRSLTLKADAPAAVYDALYSAVKIRTSSPESSETPVNVLLKTSRGDVTRTGSVSLLSENMFSGTIFSAVPPTLSVAEESRAHLTVNRPQEKTPDPLPAFLTDPVEETTPASLVKTAASLLMKSAPNGKTALVTGGAKRVGRAIAFGLARRGWNVLIHCRSSVSEAGRLVEELRQTCGVKAAYVRADFSVPKELEGFIPSTVETYGTIDALINNAAVFETDSFMTCTPETWAANMTLNLGAPFLLSQAFVRQLPKDKEGNIVNILDQRVLNPTPYFTSYTLSKAGLALLTRTAALALAPRVRVNAVAPGDAFPAPKQSKADFERRRSQSPLGKGAPADEIADAVAFILETSCMTGQILALDGGQSLNWSFENKTQK